MPVETEIRRGRSPPDGASRSRRRPRARRRRCLSPEDPAGVTRRRLRALFGDLAAAERFHAGQLLALDELEGGAAARRDVIEAPGDRLAGLLHGRRAVTAADDGEARDYAHDPGDLEGAF